MKAGAILAILLVVVAIYMIYSQITAPLPSDLPPGTLRGNVTIVGVSEYEALNSSNVFVLDIVNLDGCKYASPVFLDSAGDHYSYNMSVFPGHFKINISNDNYTSPDLPQKFTIESDKITVVDVVLVPV